MAAEDDVIVLQVSSSVDKSRLARCLDDQYLDSTSQVAFIRFVTLKPAQTWHITKCLSTCLYKHVYVYRCVHTQLYRHISVYVCAHVYMYVCLFMYAYTRLYIQICVFMHVCMYIQTCLCVCLYLHIYQTCVIVYIVCILIYTHTKCSAVSVLDSWGHRWLRIKITLMGG